MSNQKMEVQMDKRVEWDEQTQLVEFLDETLKAVSKVIGALDRLRFDAVCLERDLRAAQKKAEPELT